MTAVMPATMERIVRRITPIKRKFSRHNQSGGDMCWRLRQRYDRYQRTGAPIGACQEMGKPDPYCPLFGDRVYRVGLLGKNRACTACGRYWIS